MLLALVFRSFHMSCTVRNRVELALPASIVDAFGITVPCRGGSAFSTACRVRVQDVGFLQQTTPLAPREQQLGFQ